MTDCIQSYTATKQIILGVPPVDRFWLYGSSFDYTLTGTNDNFTVCPGENLTIYPNVPFDFSDILENQWEYVSGTYNLYSGGSAFAAYVNTSSSVGATLSLRYRYRNECGWSSWNTISFRNMNCDGGEEPYRVIGDGKLDFTLSPNPASDFVTVDVKNNSGGYELKVYDLQTFKLIESHHYPVSQIQVVLPLSDLKSGNYAVHIICKNQKVSKQLIITK